jgi:hypothetical protein
MALLLWGLGETAHIGRVDVLEQMFTSWQRREKERPRGSRQEGKRAAEGTLPLT